MGLERMVFDELAIESISGSTVIGERVSFVCLFSSVRWWSDLRELIAGATDEIQKY